MTEENKGYTEKEALTQLWNNKGAGLRGEKEKFFYATTTKRVVMVIQPVLQGGIHDSKTIERECPPGTTVLVTMFSRFGDVGIRDVNLVPPTHGYYARVLPDHLTDWRDKP